MSKAREWINNGTAQTAFDRATIDGSFAGTYQEYIYTQLTENFGITGTVNDLVAQTFLDPLNFAGFGLGKIGEATTKSIATKTANPITARVAGDLSQAFKTGQGNVLIDALPFGLQQVVAGLLKKKSSQGLLGTIGIYKDYVRTGFHPSQLLGASTDMVTKFDSLVKEGVPQHSIHVLDDILTWKDPTTGLEQTFKGEHGNGFKMPTVEELSSFEKWVGGIDPEFGYKELRPTTGKTFLQKLTLLTPKAQTSAMLNIFHHNIATLMDAASGNPDAMVGLVQKLAGQVEVKPGDIGEAILKSPAAKAVTGAMQYAMKEGDIASNMLASWVSGAERRGMMDKIAAALGETPSKILEQLKENPEVMAGRLNKIAPELNTTPEALTETMKVFLGDDALPWNVEQFQATLVNTFADKMDAYFVDKYGLKPESWVFRVSNALKGVQSLVLLGFNPAYFMNNWVNNVITRAVDGVGGHMSGKQINEFYTRLGIFPKDSGLTGFDEITGAIISRATKAQNDMLGKVQKGVSFANKAGVFSRLSGKMEKSEGNMARAIATGQFLDKTKKAGVGIRKMSPVLERILDTNYPGMKESVYGAINAGMNMKEIEASLFNTVQRPYIESIIDVIDQKYTPNTPGVSRELLRKTGIMDRLNDRLKNVVTADDVDTAFAGVEADFQDWIQKQHVETIKNQAEDAKNAVQSERVPYVLQKTGEMAIENGQHWINQRTDWDRLYSQFENGEVTKTQFNKLASELQAKHSAEMQRFNEYQLQINKGIIEGLGIETEYSRGFITGLADMNDVWKTFWKDSNKLKRDYFSQGETKSLTWEDVETRTMELYNKATKAEQALQANMDQIFAKMYADYTGWDVAKAAKWRAALMQMRENIVKAQNDMRIKTRGMSAIEKSLEYSSFNQKYNRMIADMKQFEHDGAFELMNKPVPEAKIDIPEVSNPAIDAVRQEEVRAMLRNEGRTDAEIDELAPKMGNEPDITPKVTDEAAAQAMNTEPGSPADLAAKARNGQTILDYASKSKEVVTAKIKAEDIIAEADEAKRKALIHEQGWIAKSEIETQFRESFKNATDDEINAAMFLMDQHADTLSKQRGIAPTEATKDLWYATHVDEVKTGIIDDATRAKLIQDGITEPKGGTSFADDGRAVVRAFKSHDISTMVHEIGHIFLRDLSDSQLDVVAKLGGLKDAAEYRRLEQDFRNGLLTEADPNYKRYVDAEENYARGWERYLAEGDAPTPALRSVFKQFTNWMLNIYKKLYKKNGRVAGFEGTELNVDLNQQINGVSLRDIFDRMLTDEPNRAKTFEQLVGERAAELKNEGRNFRFSDEQITAMAQKEIAANVLDGLNNPDEARASLDTMTDFKVLKDGTKVDDTVIYDALNHIEQNPGSNPWTVRAPQERGLRTKARGIGDPSKEYEFQFKVVDLDEIQASDMWVGDKLNPNPNYNQALQPRNRAENQSVTQVDLIAKELIADELLFDAKALDRGAMIVGPDDMVESGNGRALSLKRAAEMYPAKWQAYQEALKAQAADFGLDPATFAEMKNPVLVRERLTPLTPDERIAFVKDANTPIAAAMNAGEIARSDAVKVTDPMLRILDVLDNEDIFQALSSPRNGKFVNRFLEQLSPNERTGLSTDGQINQAGIARIVNALFTKVYPGAEGERMLTTFTQSLDSNIKTLQSAVMASLPQIAVAEGMIKGGMRPADLSIAGDIAKTVDMISNIRHNGMNADEYLGQMSLFGEHPADAMTPVQKAMLVLFDQKQPKKIREFLRNYARLVENEPAIGQTSVTDLVRTKLEVVNDALTNARQPGLFGADATTGNATDVTASLPDNQLAQPIPGGNSQTGTIPGGSEGLPGLVGAETIPTGATGVEPGATARINRGVEAQQDYNAGQPVPIDRAQDIQVVHGEELPVSPEVQAILNKANGYKFANKEAANTYLQWVLDGEKGAPPAGLNNKIIIDFMGDLDVLREYAAQKARGIEISQAVPQPGINIQKVFRFNHGDTPVIANVYKDGKLIAYLPEMKLTDARIDDSSRILGLDPQFPDRIVYEQDGVIKSVDSKKPTVGDQAQLFQEGIRVENATWTQEMTDNMARATIRQAEKEGDSALSDAILYEPNKGNKIALLDAAHKINPQLAERVAKQVRNQLFQDAQPEPQSNPNAPMGRVPLNGTPAIEPFSRVLDEVNSEQIRPMMDDIRSEYKRQLADKSFKWEGVADADKKAVRKYLDNDVRNDLSSVKRAAVTYGDTMRNNAMLDYSRRYGFDQVLNTIFPYQFWYTRTMLNWAKRMVDKPAWFAMYARMQKAQQRMEREGMPTRLNGKVRIPMAWMPEWMGGGLWVDPSSKIFPFEQFGQPFEQYAMNRNQVFKRAEQIVSDMKEAESITPAEANEAIKAQKGSVWERAVAQAEQELDKSANPASMAGMMMQPALWWQIPKQLAAGTPEKLSPLPITRTGQSIRDLGSDTFLEPFTNFVGDALAGPEETMRKVAGLSEFGQWGDYYLDRTLAGMASDGEITAETARIAMIQRNGAAFEEAKRRVTNEQTLRTPGASGIMALKEGANFGQTLAATLTGMFGGSLFSEGELKMRGLKPIYDNAWKKFEAGDDEAITKFFEDYPEYSARLALYDKPEERLHQFLVDSIWKKYMALDDANKTVVSNVLGDDFRTTFLNKETRDYEAVDDQTLAYWSQTIKKADMPAQVADIQGQQPKYFDDPMLQKVAEYKAEKDKLFPGIGKFQSMYFDIPAGAQRKVFLNQYPNLVKYWNWKDQYALKHPEIVPYYDELKQSSTGDVASSELTSPLIRQLLEYGTGGNLSAGAKAELERIRKSVAADMSEADFLKMALSLVLNGY